MIPANTYAADVHGKALDAGSWSQTDGLATEGMRRLYRSYLSAIQGIGTENSKLIEDLLAPDARTFDESGTAQVLGLSKLIQKMLR